MIPHKELTLQDFNERSREIFRHIVESYLTSGEPVGSRNISRALSSGLSAASVRNVMSDLVDLGLIYAPHTSAGRLPTESGLRFFIDSLLEIGPLDRHERSQIEEQMPNQTDGSSLDDLLAKTGSLLSGLTGSAGLVLAKKQNAPLKHVEFVRLDETQAMVILVSSDGQVENRVLRLPRGTTPAALTEATNYLNSRIRGNTLDQARDQLEQLYASAKEELDALTRRVVEAGIASWVESDDNAPPLMIVRGRSNLLDDMNAQSDLERIRRLFDDLEAKKDMMQLLELAEEADGVRIFIGSENPLFSLSGSSLVISPYRDQDNRIVGALGIIGPTRLNYARIIPTVDFTAQLIGRMMR